jgi:hypothetical protein
MPHDNLKVKKSGTRNALWLEKQKRKSSVSNASTCIKSLLCLVVNEIFNLMQIIHVECLFMIREKYGRGRETRFTCTEENAK